MRMFDDMEIVDRPQLVDIYFYGPFSGASDRGLRGTITVSASQYLNPTDPRLTAPPLWPSCGAYIRTPPGDWFIQDGAVPAFSATARVSCSIDGESVSFIRSDTGAVDLGHVEGKPDDTGSFVGVPLALCERGLDGAQDKFFPLLTCRVSPALSGTATYDTVIRAHNPATGEIVRERDIFRGQKRSGTTATYTVEYAASTLYFYVGLSLLFKLPLPGGIESVIPDPSRLCFAVYTENATFTPDRFAFGPTTLFAPNPVSKSVDALALDDPRLAIICSTAWPYQVPDYKNTIAISNFRQKPRLPEFPLLCRLTPPLPVMDDSSYLASVAHDGIGATDAAMLAPPGILRTFPFTLEVYGARLFASTADGSTTIHTFPFMIANDREGFYLGLAVEIGDYDFSVSIPSSDGVTYNRTAVLGYPWPKQQYEEKISRFAMVVESPTRIRFFAQGRCCGRTVLSTPIPGSLSEYVCYFGIMASGGRWLSLPPPGNGEGSGKFSATVECIRITHSDLYPDCESFGEIAHVPDGPRPDLPTAALMYAPLDKHIAIDPADKSYTNRSPAYTYGPRGYGAVLPYRATNPDAVATALAADPRALTLTKLTTKDA